MRRVFGSRLHGLWRPVGVGIALQLLWPLGTLRAEEVTASKPPTGIEKVITSGKPKLKSKLDKCLEVNIGDWSESKPIGGTAFLPIKFTSRKSLKECGCKKAAHEAHFELRSSNALRFTNRNIVATIDPNVTPVGLERERNILVSAGLVNEANPPFELRVCCGGSLPCE